MAGQAGSTPVVRRGHGIIACGVADEGTLVLMAGLVGAKERQAAWPASLGSPSAQCDPRNSAFPCVRTLPYIK